MTRRNTQLILVAAAALAVGVAAWFLDDLVSGWRTAPVPRGYQPSGSGAAAPATPRVDPPALAVVPPFDAAHMTNTQVLAHYVQQLPLPNQSPTLDEWQKLISELPKDIPGSIPLTLPLGRGHFVMAMCADLQGNLWIGTEGEGIFRYNPSKPAAEQWAKFTTKDGLGDDYGYALACDSQGRVWVGHLNHGVSVFNGSKWQLYEVVGGLSRPDSLNGPLGERIFKIADCNADAPSATFKDPLTDKESPVAGSVWMASSAGIAIYFPSTDTWSYLTRADGLPSDQANAIAFGKDGTVFIGTQCDGLAIAGPQDHYATWKQVTAANPTPHPVDGKIVDFPVPIVGKGPGLPTDLINDLLVAKDGTVYAATTLGLAWSTDKGNSWQYVRGADWTDKVKGRIGGPPRGWQPPTDADKGGGILAEDYTTALAEDKDGNLLVGHRATSGDILAPRVAKKLDGAVSQYITSYVPIPGTRNAFRGTYGDGMSLYNIDKQAAVTLLASSSASTAPIKRPSSASPPRADDLHKLAEQAKKQAISSTDVPAAASLGEDWMTQGDWLGRYGRQSATLCGGAGATDVALHWGNAIPLKRQLGPSHRDTDSLRIWAVSGRETDQRGLWNPMIGAYRMTEWDDHGEAFPASQEGPDIWTTISLPEGRYRVSFYVYPYLGQEHALSREYRDLVVNMGVVTGAQSTMRPLMRSRILFFQGGVFKQFTLTGGHTYRFEFRRNFSYNTIINGVFADRVSGPELPTERGTIPFIGGIDLMGPPQVLDQLQKANAAVREVVSVWNEIEGDLFAKRVLYRSASELGASGKLLDNWRWEAMLWNDDDRERFRKFVATALNARRNGSTNTAPSLTVKPKNSGN